MGTVTFREFRKSDAESIMDIIREAWHYDEFASFKTAGKLAKVFLYSCLANQTYTQVAVENGHPVGIIMGKDIGRHKCPAKYRFKQVIAIAGLALSGEGRKAAKIFGSVDGIDRKLLNERKYMYQGELAFFAVSKSVRGKGIGKQLFEKFLSYAGSQKIENFYLFTDTSCNYRFYESRGMTRQGKEETEICVDGKTAKMEFYIYDYSLNF